ncbi:MAG: hypothetical protein MZV64_13145 [Ignavibacteriales bacterium]|nr:hypothetical protein [Ignavibacteriales bacterium]
MAKIYYVGDWAVLTGPGVRRDALLPLAQGPGHLQLRQVAEGGSGVHREARGRVRPGLGLLQPARARATTRGSWPSTTSSSSATSTPSSSSWPRASSTGRSSARPC